MQNLVSDVTTPALIVDLPTLQGNLHRMADALPGSRLRPHVKAHKCTSLAKMQSRMGHRHFTCATVREVIGMAKAGLGEDLLLANQALDVARLRDLDARVTVAVDSVPIIDAAVGAVQEVLIDVDVGLHRCGCIPAQAGHLADYARSKGLSVRGVMGYEGHAVHLRDRAERQQATDRSMASLAEAHRQVGGDIISAGGTGTYDCNALATEIQAGSYALMDTDYGHLGLAFNQALYILATVIHASADRAVLNGGLKALGMDSGWPTIQGARILSVTDEHITFQGDHFRVGQNIPVFPAHVDPTVAYHEQMYVVDSAVIQDIWPVDLRGW